MAYYVYIDDSGKIDSSSILVLAGYLFTQERRDQLLIEWPEILAANNIHIFHMAEAWRRARGYQHLSDQKWKRMLLQLDTRNNR